MVIATFNSTTGWAGKTITYDDDVFTLEGHGVITAADVLTYDRQGHILWAYEGLQEWVKQFATASAGVATGAAHGWAVGAGGTILATTDGGATWRAQRSGTTETLNDVAFTDAENGWATGDGVVLVTRDGGGAWRPLHSGTARYRSRAFFVDAAHGWAPAAEPGAILATTNGGVTWTARRTGTPAMLMSVAFIDAAHGWASGADAANTWCGVILATLDGGATWSAGSAEPLGPLMGVAFIDATHGWVVGLGGMGAKGTKGVILATTDGGATWSAWNSGTTEYPPLGGVAFIDATHGWAVGDGGTILATTDGGTTWTAQHSGTTEDLWRVAFIDAAR